MSINLKIIKYAGKPLEVSQAVNDHEHVDAYLRQIERVGEHISPRTFSSCGLLPDWLVHLFNDLLSQPDIEIPFIHSQDNWGEIYNNIMNNRSSGAISPELLALFFSACLYPQRAHSLSGKRTSIESASDEDSKVKDLEETSADSLTDEKPNKSDYETRMHTRLGDRILSFLEIYFRNEEPYKALNRSRFKYVGKGTFREFLESYLYIPKSALDSESGNGLLKSPRGRFECAALYLSTCTKEMCERIYNNWLEDKDFVNYFKERRLTEPSSYNPLDDNREAGNIDGYWKSLLNTIMEMEPDVSEDFLRKSIELEKTTYNRILGRLSSSERSVSMVTEEVRIFWDRMIFNRLLTGFPHYAYLGPFEHWWNSNPIVISEFPKESDENLDQKAEETTNDDYFSTDMTPELLAGVKEGYRLIRSTFFSRDESNDINDPNRSIRKALDRIWEARLEQAFFDQPKSTMETISSEFPGENIRNLSKQMMDRLVAYNRVRFLKYDDSQLEHFYISGQKEPIGKKPAVKKITYITRTTPESQTLFWPLISRRKLQPHLDKRWRDPFDFKFLVEELWHFMKTGLFFEFINNGRNNGSRIDNEVSDLWKIRVIRNLIVRLHRIKSEEELHSFIETTDFTEEEKHIVDFIDELSGKKGFYGKCIECLPRFRQLIPGYSILPVWYLAEIQNKKNSQIIKSLKVNDTQISGTIRVSDTMRNCSEHSTGRI